MCGHPPQELWGRLLLAAFPWIITTSMGSSCPEKGREMLYSPLCLCFQGRRLLIIDLQPHYKSGAEGNLPCCL